jgi:hypothetical protein
VNAYDVAAWNDFAQTVGGGAAALAGLLFVGLSMNLTEVLTYPGLPARAAATLGLLIATVLAAKQPCVEPVLAVGRRIDWTAPDDRLGTDRQVGERNPDRNHTNSTRKP